MFLKRGGLYVFDKEWGWVLLIRGGLGVFDKGRVRWVFHPLLLREATPRIGRPKLC